MLKAEEIKARVDIFDLADKLGLKQPGGSGNYKSPHHPDKNPSLKLYPDGGWKDYSSGEGGSVIDLVMYVRDMDFIDALEELHDLYGWDKETKRDTRPSSQKSLAENIADNSLEDPAPAIDYLTGRGIDKQVIEHAIKRKALGWNTWTSPKRGPGEKFHGGPAAAFIIRTVNPGHVVGVEMRYQDPELNGGLKSTCQGEKEGYLWYSDLYKLKSAHTVYIVESPINVLSIESCKTKGVAAVATLGAENARTITDWRILQGKKVIACFDNDPPDDHGKRPGPEAAWFVHEQLTAIGVPCHFIDQSEWNTDDRDWNDVNDILQDIGASGPNSLKIYLNRLDHWVIPGLPGHHGDNPRMGKDRVYLPGHDKTVYWRYRAKEDFTTVINKIEKDDETGGERYLFEDVCGFRVASLSRVKIQSATATMSGEEDIQPLTRFAVTVQTPRHGNELQRKVFEDDRLHNADHWKFGPIFSRNRFLRMINILERTAGIGERNAVNFVGLAWRNGKPVVNEGPDCYFAEPEKQCPYHNLTFPTGHRGDARKVIAAYQATFQQNAASILLVWGLGGHLKAYLEKWPHAVLQSSKGAGKSTVVKRLERTMAFTMFSGQSLQTEFRLLTSISHTSHPVGWEELSARRQDVIDKAVSMLQESYQHGVTRRGTDMTEYLQCAPVLLAGEDVPVKSLTGKVIATDITGQQGDMIPNDLPRFPVRNWLQFLVVKGRAQVVDIFNKAHQYLITHCAGDQRDSGARRMIENYAGLLTSWRLLCEFARLDPRQGNFIGDLVKTMNIHITDTSADREPWVWILDTVLNEIAANKFTYPFKFIRYNEAATGTQVECLLIRPAHIMAHISSSMALRDIWHGLPVKTPRVFKQQIQSADVVYRERVDTTIDRQRHTHMMALSLDKLAEFNLHPSRPKDTVSEDTRMIDDGRKPQEGLF